MWLALQITRAARMLIKTAMVRWIKMINALNSRAHATIRAALILIPIKTAWLIKMINVLQYAGYARYEGCPIPDTDEDGINDEVDKCPTDKGIAGNNGCPEAIKKEIIQKVDYAAKRIQFKVLKRRINGLII